MAESNFRYSTLLFLSSILFMHWFNHPCCQAANISNITVTQVLKDGDILISSSQNFVLGFFSPQNSTLRYVGIWYNQTTEQGKQEVVWVANRNNSLSGTDGILRISQGNLIITDKNGNLFWSTGLNASPITSNTTIALLDDTGNFIYSSIQNPGDTTDAYWQSFKYPLDTYLPGMKVTIGNTAVEERSVLTSWNSASDVSTGRYSLGIDTRGSPQIVMWDGDSRRWRSGHWDGLVFIGVPNMSAYYSYGFKLSPDGSGNNYFIYEPNGSQILRFKVTWDGNEEELIWNETTANWNVMQREPSTTCDLYNQCGNFGTCNADNKPICSCIKGFEPMDKQQWNKGNWSGGCIRSTELQCGGNSSGSDGFLQTNNAKLPDYAAAATQALNEAGCKTVCLNNCSCRAYAYASGYKCLIWTQDLVDIQQFSDAGRTLHVRLAASDLEDKSGLSKLAIGAIVASGVIILIILVGLAWKFRNNFRACSDSSDKKLLNAPSRSREYYSAELSGAEDVVTEGKQGNAPEVPLFSFNTVATATNYFSDGNKLGQGGFGPVYKGILTGGQEVAVKRLSRKSGQGLEEFKNEIILIAKLQHRNLVRLLGWCVQEEEKMLIYEYMPNKSLDCFLFATDPSKRAELSWKTRFTIIEGIARGLLYLHRDSRLRIIHRDLKASNILLDEEMNPKISDFGMARIFGGNQNEANTNRVVGTYGYMSPEYAMEGLFSVKSDVYSFGVLLLEIISGRRNTSFRFTDNVSLIRHAWELWTVGKAEEVIDSSIKDSCFLDVVLRCLHVAMLCVQESASYRPNMSTVILMLESETAALPRPRPPPATSFKRSSNMDTWNEGQDIASSSDITVTMVAPR